MEQGEVERRAVSPGGGRRVEDMTIGDLIHSIDSLSGALERHRTNLEKTDRRSVWSQRIAIIGVCVALIGGAAAWRAIVLNNAVVGARKASCIAYNIAQQQAIDSEDKHDVVTANNIAPKPRSPTVQQQVTVYLAQEHKTAEEGHRFRLCTKAGIAAYLTNGQDDPARHARPDQFLPGQIPPSSGRPPDTTAAP